MKKISKTYNRQLQVKFLRESINGFQQDSFVHDICKIRIIILAKLTGVLEILNGAFSKTKISV